MVGFFYESTPKTGTIIGVNKHEDYPKTESDYHRFFPTDESCTAYLSWLRFDKSGYKCPRCTNEHWWRQSNGYGMCTACRLRLSPTAQTIFARTQLPLSVWFKAACPPYNFSGITKSTNSLHHLSSNGFPSPAQFFIPLGL